MKVAVTGISGYLGQVLTKLMLDDPEIETIVGIDVKEPPAAEKIRFVRRDVRDPAVIEDLKGCDALVHLAYVVMPIRSTDAVIDSINVDGTKNVFRKAVEAGVGRIVYTSSVAAYGSWPDNPVPITEDWKRRPMPDFYYARTKAVVEGWIDGFEKQHPDVAITRLRPHIFVGPSIDNLANEFFSQKVIAAIRGPRQYFQLVWDGDVAEAIRLSLKKGIRGAFNISADDWIDLSEVAAILKKPFITIPFGLAYAITKVTWALHLTRFFHPAWLSGTRYPIVVNNAKAKHELGWRPTKTTREMVAQLPELIRGR